MGVGRAAPSSGEHAAGGPLGTHGLPLVLLNIVAVALAAHFLNGRLEEWGGDNVRFLLLAEAIAQGKGYVDLFLVGTPAHTHYPPVFPLLLSPFSAWGLPLIALKGIAAAFSVAGLNIAYLFFSGIHGRLTSLLIVLSTACCGTFLDSGLSVMSEGPYFFFSMAGILLASRSLESARRPLLLAAAAGLLTGLAMLTRAVGIVFVPALVCFAGAGRIGLPSFKERLRRLFVVGAIACALGAVWPLWIGCHPDSTGGSYLRELLGTLTFQERIEARAEGRLDRTPSLPTRPLDNVRDLFTRIASTPMPRQAQSLGPGFTRGLQLGFASFCALLSALAVAALLVQLLLRTDLHDLYVFFYGLLLMMWIGGGTRLVMPLLPFLFGYLFEGVVLAGSLVTRRGIPRPAVRATARAVLAGRVVLALALAANVGVTFSFPLIHDRLTGRYAGWWDDYLRASCDLASVATPGQVVVALPDSVPFYLAGLQATPLPARRDTGALLQALLGSSADFLILTPLQSAWYGPVIRKTVLAYPEHFRSIVRHGQVEAFAIRRQPSSGGLDPHLLRHSPPWRSSSRCGEVLH